MTNWRDRTLNASGTNAHYPATQHRQITAAVSVEDFEKVKKYALEHDLSISEVIRQLIDIL